MKMIVSERNKGLFYARVTTIDGGIIRVGPDKDTKDAALSALVQKYPNLFGIYAFIDTTIQQMVPPPKQTSSS